MATIKKSDFLTLLETAFECGYYGSLDNKKETCEHLISQATSTIKIELSDWMDVGVSKLRGLPDQTYLEHKQWGRFKIRKVGKDTVYADFESAPSKILKSMPMRKISRKIWTVKIIDVTS